MSKEFTKDIYDKIQKAVRELPKEAVESTKKEQTKKGYDTTGYKYQYLVNILNEVVGVDNWGFDYEVIKDNIVTTRSGMDMYDVTVKLKMTVLNAERVSSGGHRSALYGDALKGAITNGFKKTSAFFGLGKKAYEGTIDDDNTAIDGEQGSAGQIKPSQSKSPTDQSREYTERSLDL